MEKPFFEDDTVLTAEQLGGVVEWAREMAGRSAVVRGEWGLVRPAWVEGEVNRVRIEGKDFEVSGFWMLDQRGRLFHTDRQVVASAPAGTVLRWESVEACGGDGYYEGRLVWGPVQRGSEETSMVVGVSGSGGIQWTVPAVTVGAAPELVGALRDFDADLRRVEVPAVREALGLLSGLPGGTPTLAVWIELLRLLGRLGGGREACAGEHPTVREVLRLCARIGELLAGPTSEEVPVEFDSGRDFWTVRYHSRRGRLRKVGVVTENGVDAATLACHVRWDEGAWTQLNLALTGPAGERRAECRPRGDGGFERLELAIPSAGVRGRPRVMVWGGGDRMAG